MPTALNHQPLGIQSPGIITMTKHIEGKSEQGKHFFSQIKKAPGIAGKSNDPLLQIFVQALPVNDFIDNSECLFMGEEEGWRNIPAQD